MGGENGLYPLPTIRQEKIHVSSIQGSFENLTANHSMLSSDISRPFGRPAYWFGCPNFGALKTLIKFPSFSCISTKKYVQVAINDFTMHLITLKWLGR